jgi:ABC-type multidrug transport system fused ATPase/permease subunit/CRP-like cAMP-binding protein
LALVLLLVAAGVALGASIPRVVKGLLYKDTTSLVVVFVVLLVADPIVNHIAHLRAAKLSLRAGDALRNRAFAGLATTTPLRPGPHDRAQAVTRVGTDVDRVERGFELLLVGGVAGVLRIVAALYFLADISPAAALLMACIVPLFFIAQSRLSHHLVTADRRRHDFADVLTGRVDESVTANATARGIPVGTWFRRRFAHDAHHLDELSYEQMRLEARLHLATRVVALAGLAAVTTFGVSQSGSAGELLAAILYIELAVLGLESLPPTVRALQQAESGSVRLEPLLRASEDPAATVAASPMGEPSELRLTGPDGTEFVVPRGSWVCAVTSSGEDPAPWLGGLVSPLDGSVLADGEPVTRALATGRACVVTTSARCVDASVRQHLRAVDELLDDAGVDELLGALDIAHLGELPGGGLDAPLGPQGAKLSNGERHRVLLAMALAARPSLLVAGALRPFADPDRARAAIPALRSSGVTLVTTGERASLAEAADLVLFIATDRWHLGTHAELLMSQPDYVARWQQRDADLANLGALAGAGPLEREAVRDRMITERYEPGDTIYREGAPADRVVFVVSGQVELVVGAGTTQERRVTVVGPDNACGDLRLTPDERRAETARALDLVVVRTIGRAVWEAGMLGLLRTDDVERRVLAHVLRRGGADLPELAVAADGADGPAVDAAVRRLLTEGALRQMADGRIVIGASTRRAARSETAAGLLDELAAGPQPSDERA